MIEVAEDMIQDIVEFKVATPAVMQALGQVRVEAGPLYKRGRGRSFFKNGSRKGYSCQVPGCSQSLNSLREYYKRYKICAHHMELYCLKVDGQYIRFCQQCGRFQLLSEFDGEKRSCRSKLAKHNLRRRQDEAGYSSCEGDESIINSESKRPRSQKSVVGISHSGKVVEDLDGFHNDMNGLPKLLPNIDKDCDAFKSLRRTVSEPKKVVQQLCDKNSESLHGTLSQAQNARPSIQSARSAFYAPLPTRDLRAKIPDAPMHSITQPHPEPWRYNNLQPDVSNVASEGVRLSYYRLLEIILHARRLDRKSVV